MAERECLACGAVSADDPDTCIECGGQHFAPLRGASQRRPPAYGPGDHAAVMYSSEERCIGVLLPYVRDGVAAGNRVVGVVDAATARSVDPAEWARYERSINRLLGDDALGLCLYDTRHCSPALLDAAVGHPLLGTRDRVHVCA